MHLVSCNIILHFNPRFFWTLQNIIVVCFFVCFSSILLVVKECIWTRVYSQGVSSILCAYCVVVSFCLCYAYELEFKLGSGVRALLYCSKFLFVIFQWTIESFAWCSWLLWTKFLLCCFKCFHLFNRATVPEYLCK